jgi:hypothetical protein
VRHRALQGLIACLACAAIAVAVWHLLAARDGLVRETLSIRGVPATIFRPGDGKPAPVVVIAHGFAGSQQLMESFATTLARNGYVSVTFDSAGHGRNPKPLTGSVTEASGATRTLVDELAGSIAQGEASTRSVGVAREQRDGLAAAATEIRAGLGEARTTASEARDGVTRADEANRTVLDLRSTGEARRDGAANPLPGFGLVAIVARRVEVPIPEPDRLRDHVRRPLAFDLPETEADQRRRSPAPRGGAHLRPPFAPAFLATFLAAFLTAFFATGFFAEPFAAFFTADSLDCKAAA